MAGPQRPPLVVMAGDLERSSLLWFVSDNADWTLLVMADAQSTMTMMQMMQMMQYLAKPECI